jgi:putative acetyltransferase
LVLAALGRRKSVDSRFALNEICRESELILQPHNRMTTAWEPWAMSPAIRKEQPSDVAAIHALTTAAFSNAPHADGTEQFVVDALRKAGALSISLVAEYADEVVGHVAVSPVAVSDGSRDWFGLGPISVAPKYQGQSIGSELIKAALRLLRERGAAGCVLLGDPAYYSRFGFKPTPALILPDVPPEYFQAQSFGQSSPNGVVTYHEAFGAKD